MGKIPWDHLPAILKVVVLNSAFALVALILITLIFFNPQKLSVGNALFKYTFEAKADPPKLIEPVMDSKSP